MIRPEQIWLAVEPVDMRCGMNSLTQLVQDSLGEPACGGRAYGFTNRTHTRLKLLVWDGTGVWLCQRRLHQGKFIWPKLDDRVLTLTEEQWDWLIKGVDWQKLGAKPSDLWRV